MSRLPKIARDLAAGSRAGAIALRDAPLEEDVAQGKHEVKGDAISKSAARELALSLLRMKIEAHPALLELAEIRSREVTLRIANGLKVAFTKRGLAVDYEAAEGIAEAIQEVIPSARDIIQQLR